MRTRASSVIIPEGYVMKPGGLVVEVTDGTARYNESHYRLNVYYDLAKVYRQNNQETQAFEVLNKAMRLRPIYQDDPAIKAECKKMLEDMQ